MATCNKCGEGVTFVGEEDWCAGSHINVYQCTNDNCPTDKGRVYIDEDDDIVKEVHVW